MKTRLLLAMCMYAMVSLGQNAIPNGSFENWNSKTFDYPEYYPYTSNSEDYKDATFNLTKTTSAYSGSYAVKITTVATVNNDVKFGYFLNGNPNDGNPDQWKGGIPCSEKPAGIKGYFKYNVATGDTGLIIVTFRKSGVNIGTYFFPLTGIHTEYTLFDFNFTPALTVTPDTILLGFASSFAIKETGLPGSELYIDNISLTGVSAQPEKLNGDFESWKSVSVENIESWYVQNNNSESCRKTSDAKDGNYAIELQTYTGDENGTQVARPSMISTGFWNDKLNKWDGGIPYNYVIDTLAFNYKYAPADPNGHGQVFLQFKKNGNLYGYSSIDLPASANYKYVEIPFNLYYMGKPDSVIISVLSGLWSETQIVHIGSVLKIDDLHFKATSSTPPVVDIKIPNGGFENWDLNSYDYPLNYPYGSNADRLYDKTAGANVFKTTDAQSGSYAIRLKTDQATERENFGYILNSRADGDPDSWKGGIPINERPTGIKGFFKYNVAAGDTGLIIVTFRKSGNNIGSYFLPLSGVHTSYTEFNYPFSPALTETPDSMILGFASSWAINEIQLPGSELFIDNISLTGVSAQPEKLNGDFEFWGSKTVETPQNWNSQTNDPDACIKTQDASEGNFALELHTIPGENDGTPKAEAAHVTNGYWNDNTGKWSGGIPYNSAKNLLSFYYKYSPAQSSDNAEVWLMFKKNGNDYGYRNINLNATDTYKQIILPLFPYNFFDSPDTVIIGIRSNLWSDTLTTHIGSILKIDDIKFIEGGSDPTTPVVPAIIPNADFESWNSFTYEYPEFYSYNSNSRISSKDAATINLFKTNDAEHGGFAARLITNDSNDENNFGYFLNGSPNDGSPEAWTGGIPISEKPTGIKGYFKYNRANGDTALIIATFSKAGKNVGSYFLPLSGLHTTYTAFDLTFNPALTETPDSMILGFASSMAISKGGLPGSELYIDNISLNGITTQPSMLNGDFETWNSNTIESPQSWYNSNEDNENACKKTTDAASGNFAVELKTYLGDNDGNPQARPGEVSTGYWNDNKRDWVGGSPFTNSIDTLSFYYKYAPAQPNDSAQVSVQFKMNGETFWYNNVYLTASTDYKYAEIPIMIMNPFYRADSVIIFAQSNLWSDSLTTHVGSVLKIDNFHFKSEFATSIDVAKEEPEIILYPNPTSGRFSIHVSDNVIERIDIYNLSGQKVMTLGKDQIQNETEIDLTLYPRGLYLIKINDGSKTYVEKLILR